MKVSHFFMAISRFFKMSVKMAACIKKFEILTAGTVVRANLFHRAKFRVGRVSFLILSLLYTQAVAEILPFSIFFQNSGCPPYWICFILRNTCSDHN